MSVIISSVQFSRSLSGATVRVRLFVTQWTAACQACLSITSSWSLLKLVSIESVMPSTGLLVSIGDTEGVPHQGLCVDFLGPEPSLCPSGSAH